MPLDDRLRICVYGDSHIACIKRAVDEGRVDLTGIALEFWGAPGPRFRDIHLKNGRLAPTTDQSRAMVARVNAQGRATLAAQDFDGFVFVGSRLRASAYLTPLLYRDAQPDGFLSQAVRQVMLERWLNSCRAYRVAREFAQSVPLCFAPAGFLNDQVVPEDEIAASINTAATTAARRHLWDGISQAMATDGITLLAQPESTVTRGALTRLEYAAEAARADGDTVHKNGAYGALLLTQALAHLRKTHTAPTPARAVAAGT